MNPTTSFDTKAASARPATISNGKEDTRREILKTYFFERIDCGTGADETPLYTLGQGRETLSDAEAQALGPAHPRLHRAHLHPSLRQGGRRDLAAPTFGTAANQGTLKNDLLSGGPFERGVRFASVLSQLGGFTMRRPAFSPWQNFASNALNCGHCSGRWALRVRGPSAIADAAIRRSFPESSGFVCPFFPSSLSPKTLLRAKRKGGGIQFDLSSGAFGNQPRGSLSDSARQTGLSYLRVRFPGSNDRQECTFPRKSAEAGRWRSLSRHSCACQARFGGSHLFSNAPTKQPQ
jgi:hypothetical protein